MPTPQQQDHAQVGAAFESGMVSINHHGLALPEVPFGGMKDSGYGSEGGIEALEAYLNTKFISQLGFRSPPRWVRARRHRMPIPRAS
jgi:succinate-semialdehyde dehydrogenase/glutarate-semialdehyde dehydrogenase